MPNDMRDRLIELIDGFGDDIAFCDICDRPEEDCEACKNEQLAEYLIENGVILPPCKVGNKVYFDTYLHGDSVGVQSHKVINVKYIIITEPSKGGIGAEIPDYAFGKTVFLALEEAEKEIKDGAEE